MESVDESIETICRMPHIGAPKQLRNPSLEGLRFWAVKGFEDFLIFYAVQGEVLRVVRVLNAKRDIKKILAKERMDETPN